MERKVLLLLAAGVLGLVGWVLSLVALVFQYTYKNDFVSVDFASIWTTTTSKEDIDGAYRFGATCIFLIVLFGLCVVLASFAGAFNAAKANADTNGIGRATTVGYIILLILACLSYTYRAASKTNLDWGPTLDNSWPDGQMLAALLMFFFSGLLSVASLSDSLGGAPLSEETPLQK